MSTQHTQIIAMGGGGFSSEPENPLLDQYVLDQCPKENPVVCFVPTASGDSLDYTARFYKAFSKLPCQPRHLSLFSPPPDLSAYVAECDIIYVGGGNTRNLMAIWKEWGLDVLIRKAWEKGTVLCGISAGAICWFEYGLTDSAGPLAPMKCLGFLPGSCTPHYDGEADRQPCYLSCIREGTLPAGFALDDGAAAHFIGTKFTHTVTSRPNARAFMVRREGDEAVEKKLDARYLG